MSIYFNETKVKLQYPAKLETKHITNPGVYTPINDYVGIKKAIVNPNKIMMSSLPSYTLDGISFMVDANYGNIPDYVTDVEFPLYVKDNLCLPYVQSYPMTLLFGSEYGGIIDLRSFTTNNTTWTSCLNDRFTDDYIGGWYNATRIDLRSVTDSSQLNYNCFASEDLVEVDLSRLEDLTYISFWNCNSLHELKFPSVTSIPEDKLPIYQRDTDLTIHFRSDKQAEFSQYTSIQSYNDDPQITILFDLTDQDITPLTFEDIAYMYI